MVLGFLLYEAVDLVFHVTKIGYNGIVYGYSALFTKEKENSIIEINEESMVRIQELERKVNFLEELLHKRCDLLEDKLSVASTSSFQNLDSL